MSEKRLNLRKLLKIGVTCLAVVVMFSCAKDGNDGKDGRDGINGINGTDGRNGVDGTNGTDGIHGNAGVMMYVWKNVTFTGVISYTFSQEEINIDADSSLIYVYYDDGIIHPIPRPFNGVYSATWFITDSGDKLNIRLRDGSGVQYATSVTWNELRLVVVPIPEGNIIHKSAGNGYPIDWNNYSEVAAYFELPE